MCIDSSSKLHQSVQNTTNWIMDFKCMFIVLFALVLCHQIRIDSNNSDRYSIKLCQHFQNINYVQLYNFVLFPDLVNKVKFNLFFRVFWENIIYFNLLSIVQISGWIRLTILGRPITRKWALERCTRR